MRRVWKLVLAAVGVPLVGAAVLAAPSTGELMIALTCRSAPQTQNCITRMRAMGHVWVYWGAFDRASYWYRRREEQYRSSSQSGSARRTPISLESR